MDYIFGSAGESECLKTVGGEHSDLLGYIEIRREYDDAVITDRLRVVRHTDSKEDAEGKCYDWYDIDSHYRMIDKTGTIVAALEKDRLTSGIAFVSLAEAGTIDAVTAGEHAEIFAPWEADVSYTSGQLRNYGGKLYRCEQAHKSQSDWTPAAASSLWTPVSDPSEAWPAWSQPIGAQDAYAQGAKVSHGGKRWTSNVAANVWEPGIYGWAEATA